MPSMPLESSSCWERMFQRIGRPPGSGSRKQRSREISTPSILWSVWITGIFFPLCSQPPGCSTTWAGIFREQSQPSHPRGLRLTVDKKLWRKIREKKIAMGHKPTIMKNRPSRCNGGFNVKKKYNSTATAPSKAGRSARRLESWRRCATVRQVPYHRKTRQRRR